MLVQKPFYEKGQGLILPQMDGPYQIQRVTTHTALLVDPLTDAAAFQGKEVAFSRLALFRFPLEGVSGGQAVEETQAQIGDLLAIELIRGQASRIHLAHVLDVYTTGEQLRVKLLEVPKGERYGPWSRRP